MDAKTLKMAIQEDLQTLKTLDPDLLEASTFWGAILKILGSTYLFIFLSTIIIAMIAKALGAHSAFDIPFFHEDIHSRSTLLATIQKAGIISLFPCALVAQYVNLYVLMRYQFLPHLKTGPYFIRQAHKLLLLAALFYLVSFSIMIYGTGPNEIFMAEVGSLIFTVLGTAMMATAELERAGASLLLKGVQHFFHRPKAANP